MDFANASRLQFYVSGAGTVEVLGNNAVQVFLFDLQAHSQTARD
ncbi:MAG: hypothetical protein ACRD3Y_08205 [Bryobacteraceae bacterium]